MGAIVSPVTSALGAVSAVSGAALPAISTATRLVNTVQNFSGAGGSSAGDRLRAQQDLALQQLQDQQQLRSQQASSDAAINRQRIAVDAAAADANRRAALRRAVARQRAQFSASGVTSAGGSSEAVLLGLFNETETEASQRQQIDGLRNRALDQGLSNQRSVNVLQRTQLQQRQNLQRSLF